MSAWPHFRRLATRRHAPRPHLHSPPERNGRGSDLEPHEGESRSMNRNRLRHSLGSHCSSNAEIELLLFGRKV